MKMILYTGIQKNSNYLINILHCILIMTEMQHCNSIGIVYFLKYKFLCFSYNKIKCVTGLLFYMVHGILPREELSWLMSELGSGGRGEALVRALVLHQCGPGSGLGM